MYRTRSIFIVTTIGTGNAFNSIKFKLRDNPYQVTLTTCDDNQHVKVIARMIHFIKEHVRVVHLAMSYKKTPKQFTIKMVHRVAILVNLIPR